MKNTIKVLGTQSSPLLSALCAIALLAVIAFSMAACGDDSGIGSGGGGSFANTTWRSSDPPYPFNQQDMVVRLKFITSGDWAVYITSPIMGEMQGAAGSYTVSSGTATLSYLYVNEYGKATISGNTLTILGQMATYGSTWTRE
jgi:hypothetical protein